MNFELALSLVGLFASISSIVFAYLAFKRSNRQEQRIEGKNEGVMFSDIGYIKACVDRVEKNLNKVDERYRNIAERIAKLEESVVNVTKRVDEIYKLDGP
jgi:archaellum component FlaC